MRLEDVDALRSAWLAAVASRRRGAPLADRLPCLTPAELSLYRDLVEDALDVSLRLEQERISYDAIERALRS